MNGESGGQPGQGYRTSCMHAQIKFYVVTGRGNVTIKFCVHTAALATIKSKKSCAVAHNHNRKFDSCPQSMDAPQDSWHSIKSGEPLNNVLSAKMYALATPNLCSSPSE